MEGGNETYFDETAGSSNYDEYYDIIKKLISENKTNPGMSRKWFTGLTKAPPGIYESVEIEELEKHCVAGVQNISQRMNMVF